MPITTNDERDHDRARQRRRAREHDDRQRADEHAGDGQQASTARPTRRARPARARRPRARSRTRARPRRAPPSTLIRAKSSPRRVPSREHVLDSAPAPRRRRICREPAVEDPRPVEHEEDREDEPGEERDAAASPPTRSPSWPTPPASRFGMSSTRFVHALARSWISRKKSEFFSSSRRALRRRLLQAAHRVGDVVHDLVADEADRAEPDEHEQHHDAGTRGSQREPNCDRRDTRARRSHRATSTHAITRSESTRDLEHQAP